MIDATQAILLYFVMPLWFARIAANLGAAFLLVPYLEKPWRGLRATGGRLTLRRR
jgi:hypothetical protein